MQGTAGTPVNDVADTTVNDVADILTHMIRNEEIRVLTLNIHYMKSTTDKPKVIEEILQKNEVDVALLQETQERGETSATYDYVDRKKDVFTRIFLRSSDYKYYWFINDRVEKGSPGTAIAVKRELAEKEEFNFYVRVLEKGRVQLMEFNGMVLINVYISSDRNNNECISTLRKETQDFANKPMLIGGDWNMIMYRGDRQKGRGDGNLEPVTKAWEDDDKPFSYKNPSRQALCKWSNAGKIFDLWRRTRGAYKEYTFKKIIERAGSLSQRSRLDRFYGTNELIDKFDIETIEVAEAVYGGYNISDHRAVLVTLKSKSNTDSLLRVLTLHISYTQDRQTKNKKKDKTDKTDKKTFDPKNCEQFLTQRGVDIALLQGKEPFLLNEHKSNDYDWFSYAENEVGPATAIAVKKASFKDPKVLAEKYKHDLITGQPVQKLDLNDIVIINVYISSGPRENKYISTLREQTQTEYAKRPVLLGGHWNMVLEGRDRQKGAGIRNKDGGPTTWIDERVQEKNPLWTALDDWTDSCSWNRILDLWREKKGNATEYTFQIIANKEDGSLWQRSRLDRFYRNNELMEKFDIETIKVVQVNTEISDHDAVLVTLKRKTGTSENIVRSAKLSAPGIFINRQIRAF